MKHSLLFILGITLLLLTGCTSSRYVQSDIDTLAKCLTEKGVKEYGAFWCPHCAQVRKNFGTSYKYVTYVECDARGDNEQSETCIKLGIDKYATFIFPDNPAKENWAVGEPTFEELAQKSGCPAPQRK